MFDFQYANPGILYLLLLLPLMLVYYILREANRHPEVRISSMKLFGETGIPLRLVLRHALFGLRLLAMAALIIALARPQSVESWSQTTTEGVDICLVVDISGSMRAMDFKPNRLEAAKDVGAEFINGRPYDRFAIVGFSSESFTVCPLTTDRGVAVKQLTGLNFGLIEDGTAIGLAIATGVNRLKNSDAESKVIILLTDGENNSGTIGPSTAADIAAELGIRIYSIGVGTHGTAPYPVNTALGQRIQQMPVSIDEETLKEISDQTGGRYFRATDKETLAGIYEEIDKLEKTILETRDFSEKKEEYFVFLLTGVLILLSEVLLRNTLLKTLA